MTRYIHTGGYKFGRDLLKGSALSICTRFLCRLLLLNALMLVFTGATLHHGTTIDPATETLTLTLPSGAVRLLVKGSGTHIEKRVNGELARIRTPYLDGEVLVTFHPGKRHGKEIIATYLSFYRADDTLLRHGASYSFDPAGRLLSEEHWNMGILDGVQTRYHYSGQVIATQEYDQGIPVGTWRQYYVNGNIAGEISFPKTRSIWEESFARPRPAESNPATLYGAPSQHTFKVKEQWFDYHGNRQREILYRAYQEGERIALEPTGISRSFHPDGSVVRETAMQNGSGTDTYFRAHNGDSYREESFWLSDRLILRRPAR